jgi:uncharacterized radical SAM protein YgiQ
MSFLPITKEEMNARGWEAPDFVCVTGDAYVDHPSFGVAIISRLLESKGYRVVILAQPDFSSPKDFRRFGRPRYAFLVTGGNIDSMVAHYTAAKRRRSDDAYTPGNVAGKRPDRACTVYARLCKEAYPDVPVVIGGLEASLRRFAHYDYWDDAVRPSILVDSGADLLSFGMGEHSMVEIADAFAAGKTPRQMRDIRGICYLADLSDPVPQGAVSCASFDKVRLDKTAYARASRIQLEQQDHAYGKAIVQKHGDKLLVQNPPALPLTQEELDAVSALPYERYYHPSYEALGGVKAIEEVEFSIIHNRGCFGGCNFCSIAFHQGRVVTARSHESVLQEARAMVKNPRFKGYIHDVGGPTANFRGPSCQKQLEKGVCMGKKCLFPSPCPALKADHTDYIQLLRELRAIPGVKKVFVRSGLRYDYIMADKTTHFLDELVRYHVSGQLKVAPEHISPPVLARMGKPSVQVYNQFCKAFYEATRRAGKEQYLVPYLISSHPGSTMADAVALALYLKKNHIRPEQVQDFYPTPATASTTMFYTGIDPWTMEKVFVPTDPWEKKLQRALLQYYKPENRRLCIEALIRAGREDLIGNGPGCLVQPDREYLLRLSDKKKAQAIAGSRRGGRGASPTRGRTFQEQRGRREYRGPRGQKGKKS